jgi:hypothetical protein
VSQKSHFGLRIVIVKQSKWEKVKHLEERVECRFRSLVYIAHYKIPNLQSQLETAKADWHAGITK